MKKNLLISLFFLLALASYAGKVDLRTAQLVGTNFYYQRLSLHQQVNYQSLSVKESFTENYNGNAVYYVFNFTGQGYVMVSAIDDVIPVLAYSFDGSYSRENQPTQFIGWVEGYAKEIDYSVQHPTVAPASVQDSWRQLSAANPANLPYQPLTDVAPMEVSTWDQGANYNLLCPADPAGPGGHVWAGCVATAMSQVMYYYRWPVTGQGSNCYTPQGYPQQCADFGNTTYQWDQMVNSLSFKDTAMATLIWHAGVSVDMMYSPSGSGAYSQDALTAMINNFRYSPNAQLIARDSYPPDDTYPAILRDNLDHGRVMYYDGYGTGGHAFNVDGYQGTDYFHFNWGWSGSFNGYFYLNNLNPGGDNFTNGQHAMINLYPDTIANTYPSYCTGQQVLTSETGTFEDGSGPVMNYQNNANCSWLISPQSLSDSIISITLNFNRFSTEENADFVTIYKGTTTNDSLVGTFSGDTFPPSLTIPGNRVLVTFTSNGNTVKSGWYLSYSSKSMNWCKTTTIMTADQGSFSDGSLNFNYKNSTNCRWEIIPESGGPVLLTFSDFNTEPTYDHVRVIDMGSGQVIADLSGDYPVSDLPSPIVAWSGKMFIMFLTNDHNTDRGWEASYVTYPLGSEELQTLTEPKVFPNPASDELSFSINNSKETVLNTELVTLDGKTLMSRVFDLTAGIEKRSLDINSVPAGIYILRMTTQDKVYTKKVVIE